MLSKKATNSIVSITSGGTTIVVPGITPATKNSNNACCTEPEKIITNKQTAMPILKTLRFMLPPRYVLLNFNKIVALN
jgi:hypothetical protein